LWLLFSPLAALMSYLITYDEYRRHFPDRGRVVRESLRTAMATFLVFLVLGLAVTALLSRILR
jgi:hypothetical protein